MVYRRDAGVRLAYVRLLLLCSSRSDVQLSGVSVPALNSGRKSWPNPGPHARLLKLSLLRRFFVAESVEIGDFTLFGSRFSVIHPAALASLSSHLTCKLPRRCLREELQGFNLCAVAQRSRPILNHLDLPGFYCFRGQRPVRAELLARV
jgi:hypothetical protein